MIQENLGIGNIEIEASKACQEINIHGCYVYKNENLR